jgi:hypothetical protein
VFIIIGIAYSLGNGFAELLHYETRDDEGLLVLTGLGYSLEELLTEFGP